MNHGLSLGIVFTLFASQSTPLDAQAGRATCGVQTTPRTSNTRRSATDILHVRYFGTVNRDRTDRVLDELVWHKSMGSAIRSARKNGRPIVLFQALGDIRGLC